MTDITLPVLPELIYTKIAEYLSPIELLAFKLSCLSFNKIGTLGSVLQPHYNRLCALDPTLPKLLPNDETAFTVFQAAFQAIRQDQDKEIKFLSSYHLSLLVNHDCLRHTPTTIQALEERTAALDAVNCFIISRKIDEDLNATDLTFWDALISRLPVSLIKDAKYQRFWQQLQSLALHSPMLRLDLRNLT
jgi:hypothetical protein